MVQKEWVKCKIIARFSFWGVGLFWGRIWASRFAMHCHHSDSRWRPRRRRTPLCACRLARRVPFIRFSFSSSRTKAGSGAAVVKVSRGFTETTNFMNVTLFHPLKIPIFPHLHVRLLRDLSAFSPIPAEKPEGEAFSCSWMKLSLVSLWTLVIKKKKSDAMAGLWRNLLWMLFFSLRCDGESSLTSNGLKTVWGQILQQSNNAELVYDRVTVSFAPG